MVTAIIAPAQVIDYVIKNKSVRFTFTLNLTLFVLVKIKESQLYRLRKP